MTIIQKMEECPSDFGVFAAEIQKMEMTIYLYGFIEYETMGTKWHYPFGYFWVPTGSDSDFGEGLWDGHSKLNKAEYEINENPN